MKQKNEKNIFKNKFEQSKNHRSEATENKTLSKKI